ncbi:MAG: MerR family transcriptional regulator [FCB group bacterium]|nr:MerR family transcriptional regulator [FCB group bacterium]
MNPETDISTTENKSFIDTAPLYTIGVVARLTGLTVHTIRMYENKRLILPYRTESNRRLYSKVDIDRLNCIHNHISNDGLNIAGIKSLMAMIPCWIIKPCSEEQRSTCDAFTNQDRPCWEATNKSEVCLETDCRECPVYLKGYKYGDIKALCKHVYKHGQL